MTKITTQRKKTFRWFSKYIRKKEANFDGYTRCVTCGARKQWKELHAGHFIHGVTKPTYFEETNVNPQCNKCNTFLGGKLDNYTLYMIDTYGRKEVDRLKKLEKGNKYWGIKELKAIEEEYKQKFKELDNKNIDL